MNRGILRSLAFLVLLAVGVHSQIGMRKPLMRSSLWRQFPGYKTYQLDEEWCEIHEGNTGVILANSRHATCGVAGPIYNNNLNDQMMRSCNPFSGCRPQPLFSYEYGSPHTYGGITSFYREGETIDVVLRVTTNYGGLLKFALCEAGPDGQDPPANCFVMFKNLLEFESGRKIEVFPIDKLYDFDHTVRVKLPAGRICSHCILQVVLAFRARSN